MHESHAPIHEEILILTNASSSMHEFQKSIHLVPHSTIVAIPDFLEQISKCPNEASVVLFSYDKTFNINDRIIPFASPNEVAESLNYETNKRVVVHGLNPRSFPYIRHLRRRFRHIRIDWIYWGEMRGFGESMFDPKTATFRAMVDSKKRNWLANRLMRGHMKDWLHEFRMSFYSRKFRKHARLFDVMYHWSNLDFEAIKSAHDCKSLQFQYFCYISLEGNRERDSFILKEMDLEAGRYIIVGHSASHGNNHLDVLPEVARFAANHGFKVVVPLSYSGTSNEYKDSILKINEGYPHAIIHAIEKIYSQEQYYGFLIQSGGFVAPAKGSMGAASLFESVANDRIPVSNSKNPTAQFLKSIGCEVAMYDTYDDVPYALESACNRICHENGKISASYFSAETITLAYTRMLSGEI